MSSARIDHVVVLMLENRSFDHLFGFHPGVNGLSGGEYNLLDPGKPESESNPALHVGKDAPWAITRGSGPAHSFGAANWQLAASADGPSAAHPAANNGFALNYRNELVHDRVGDVSADDVAVVMQSFGPGRLPALETLAENFVLCDQWYSEVPGPTMPNRLYMHAATSAGFAHNVWSHVFDFRTIYENLQDHGKSWGVYYENDNLVAKFSRVNSETDRFHIYSATFAEHARAGTLPAYSFIIPRFSARNLGDRPVTSMHAPHDVRYGDHLVAEVYEAVRGNPDAWPRTLLVVTFDEHGGFYDHVVPPADGVPNPDGLSSPPAGDAAWAPTFGFDRLGFRVPTILVSPLLPRGKVDSTRYQHTSILATVKELYGLPHFLTRRDASANTFEHLLDELAGPRVDTPVTLPRVAIPEAAIGPEHPAHPANRPPDATVRERVDGWHAITRDLPPGPGGDAVPTTKPTTERDADQYLRDQVQRYLRHRAAGRRRARFEIAGEGDGFRWKLLGKNGEAIAISDQTFASRESARRNIERVRAEAPGAELGDDRDA